MLGAVQDDQTTLEAARAGDEVAFARLVDPHRRALRAHCYRFSGSLHDAEDLLQESLLRAWRGLGSFEGRSGLATWLFKVSTRVCLDALDKRPARRLPNDLGPPVPGSKPPTPPRLDPIWIEPCPDSLIDETTPTPETPLLSRESVALAFLVALQLLPPRQRAVLLLHDVLGWSAPECGESLGLSAAAVNSALQRARETINSRAPARDEASPAIDDPATAALLSRYVKAWESTDVPALVALLREDATLVMPPLPDWIRGAAEIGASLTNMVLVPGTAGRYRLVPTRANGLPALATYRRDDAGGAHRATSIQIFEIRDGRIATITAFLDGSLFPLFGLPDTLA
jgi:RNA polymerase sigma-70 factor (ECF subfamily)